MLCFFKCVQDEGRAVQVNALNTGVVAVTLSSTLCIRSVSDFQATHCDSVHVLGETKQSIVLHSYDKFFTGLVGISQPLPFILSGSIWGLKAHYQTLPHAAHSPQTQRQWWEGKGVVVGVSNGADDRFTI